MNKKLMWMSAFVVSMSLMNMPVANADHTMGHHCDYINKLEKNLDLTAEQKSKIQSIKARAKDDLKDKFKQIRETRHQINELINSGSSDASKIDDLVKQETDLMGAVIRERISVRQQIFALLTDVQKEKFKAMVKDWEAKKQHKSDESDD